MGGARAGLRAFLHVRRALLPKYPTIHTASQIGLRQLANNLTAFCAEKSEYGRRVQAAVAGLADAAFGPARVLSGRVNDPSRHFPGDVAILGTDGTPSRSLEVRDKITEAAQAESSLRRAAEKGAAVFGFALMAKRQPHIDKPLAKLAESLNVTAHWYYEWEALIAAMLAWGSEPPDGFAARAIETVARRLQEIEAEPASVESWLAMNAGNAGSQASLFF